MRRLLLAVLSLCTVTLAQPLQVVPTTTLTAETGNNTSAANSYTGSYTGNAVPGNVSKISARSLLYAGADTKLLIAMQGWFGKSSHISVGYSSPDPAQVARQISDMQSRGFEGLTIAWYGSGSSEQSNLTTQAIMAESEKHPGFTFALRVNESMLKWYSNGMSYTDAFIYHLNYAADTFFPSPAYMRLGGRPVVLLFGFESYNLDWNKIVASVRGNPVWIWRNANGFTRPYSAGGFAWGPASGFSYLDWFYDHALTYTSQQTLGNAYKGFDDRLASWSQNRIVDQRCGQTWLDSWAWAGHYYSKAQPLPFMMVSTWNDYEEGTEIETGIDNCLSVAATLSGSSLQWTLSGTGTENTVHHYTVFVSADGENLMRLSDVAAGTRTLDIGSFGLAPGTYTLYVEAVGQPSIRNHMSNGVAFKVANQPPIANISLSAPQGVAPFAETVSLASSSDADGSLASYLIDFGDGAVATSASATHTYTAPGSYTITGTVTDDLGASTSTSAPVSVLQAVAVNISAPLTGASQYAPVRVTASASAGRPITSMTLRLDGATAYSSTSSSLDTYLKPAPGTHLVSVEAQDSGGLDGVASATVTVVNQAPTARLTLSNSSGVGPLAVSASSAGSADADGSIVSTVIDFGDGYLASGASASHTYTVPGSYAVKVTVTDNNGATAAASAAVKVDSGVAYNSPANGATVGTKFLVSAWGFSSKPVVKIQATIDGAVVYSAAASSMNAYLTAKPGTRTLVVYIWNAEGTMYKATRYLNVVK